MSNLPINTSSASFFFAIIAPRDKFGHLPIGPAPSRSKADPSLPVPAASKE
jgi:hypothetical protein